MGCNLLFIIPPALPLNDIEVCGKIKCDTYIPTSIPIGVLSICAYAQKNLQVEIRILDFNIILNECSKPNMSFNDILTTSMAKIGNGFKPDVIGISALFNSNYSYLERISMHAKELYPDSIVVAGGGLPTNLYGDVLDSVPHIDAVCFGEGEIPMLDLLKSENRFEYLKEDNCWITSDKLQNGLQPSAKYVFDLDEIPLFDYSLINFGEYQRYNRYHGDSTNLVGISLMTSRGCPFHCCFCASHSVHGRKIRLMSAERVLQDIDYLIKEYGVNTLLIEDDHFLIDKNRALKILEGLRGKGLSLEFPNGLAVYAIDEEVADAMKEAGVNMVTLAVESGSEYVLKEIIHKPLNLSIVTKVVSILRSREIYIRAFFIIGFPGEKEEDRNLTIEFIKKTGFNWVGIMIATPIAGSELYKICKENNYLASNDVGDFYYGKANIKTEDFSPEYIEEKRYLMNLDLNFVHNYDLLNGSYETALIGFNDVIKRVPNHAFAHYFAAKCYEGMDKNQEKEIHLDSYRKIIDSDVMWQKYAEEFKLER